ncbi:ChaN family lipoprotein [Hymenobacter taeanensis]|uniref:ChaN family lipoprotein n=1 Tax=Hymenobacter taeanensis TaxID=2735321 RepID=A0A6M6BIG5_9BACT|nr:MULTISPECIES: ChaN family lipoprotein [Hymenobacter]QJX47584.1 ChaN family lipoprotein [Hymenobacter taeanensis]UOQ82932.1 ChaN family lipoprotein [Hymenobacter sp. 5414T-23]
MTRKFLLLPLLLLLLSFTMKDDKPAYRLFTAAGKPVTYDKMLKELAAADVVFFGEQHNDPIAHWLELQLTKDLLRLKQGQVVLGLEMFERDVQPLVDQYTTGELTDKEFEEQSRPWPNYATDYKPLLQLAKQQKFRVVGTNVPRRYASQVAKGSLTVLNDLPTEEKVWLMPLPLTVDYELPGYQNMAKMFGGDAAHAAGVQNIIQAQALKDATMAHFLAQARPEGHLLLHLNGSYHSDNHDGILAYLRQQTPKLRVLTISTVLQEQLGKLEQENEQKADFVLAVPQDMTRTY